MIKYMMKFCPAYGITSMAFIISQSVIGLAEVLVVEDVLALIYMGGATFPMIMNVIVKFLVILLVCLLINRFHDTYLRHRFRNIWVKKIQQVMFEKAANIDIECFDDPKQYDLFTRALREGDIKGIDTFDTIVRFLSSLGQVITVGTYIIFQDVILMVLVFTQAIVSYIINSKSTKMWYKTRKENETNNRRYSYIKRVFYLEKNTCDIKTTKLSDLLIQNQMEVNNNLNISYGKAEKKNFIYWIVEDILYQITRNIFGYAYLMKKVYDGKISISAFSSTIVAIFKFTNYIYGVAQGIVSIRENSMYIDDFLWLMKYQPQVEKSGGNPVKAEHPVINISNLSFKYPGQSNYALKDISLSLKPKEKIAIIGYNGAGKTTLIKLLLKFYNIEEGKILFDNNNYSDLDEREIRSKYTSVFQNFQIYSVTVLENILFRKRINEEDDMLCWEALKKAGLAEKIRNTKAGLDTILTKEFDDEGLMLSGGEKQKLAMARVFASSAPIIILDEPTSSLDPISEYEINKKIIELCHEKTVIMISHRLSTIIDASKIYMFSKGEIIEMGTHNELMSRKGKYFEMFETQAKLYKESI